MALDFPELGQPAPDFTTLNQREEEVALSDLKGKKVVLYFYPKAMTPGCTVQACGLRDTQKELDDRNVVVLGLSPDAPKRLQKFIDRDELNFDLLSDEDHAIAEKYGVWAMKKFMGREFMGVHRITFIIDEDGKLVHIMEKVKTKTHHDDLIAALDAL
ncbi:MULTISPECIES: thioredoxin-dependent thiol peroxidase [Thalassolituus]|mgnify:CR=1 FL=1|uniref:thioredoxin-dependent peroxiredoxin n=2 Tax=Thalassolituus TaxID=187492 RepID=A0A1N7LIR7_9GAMM|nr:MULTISPECIES: thioredoxin-dependent thiol peroxidase [Thalassolituus]KZY98947.1 peroxiredoxin [Oleibacter sp. HI0075]MAX87833.1 thioredoxin-dependent thiol peroxidase [Oceanospirillaceae bacterium]MED5441230.1 thioredoxin-dependent thiol peroxidase [Pseudomonadota bacterium]HCG79066.1 thioredoxin-dependent thiol peroxidase [Oceanospirillales bacterium]MEE2749582.1 thioredoxin-dependent thiol peroxidase [Pseudomonadota bacterium]|tara:strand:- start:35 stop:508 length:474 start_codon:yes stop_codon:yes gene_type:complete